MFRKLFDWLGLRPKTVVITTIAVWTFTQLVLWVPKAQAIDLFWWLRR